MDLEQGCQQRVEDKFFQGEEQKDVKNSAFNVIKNSKDISDLFNQGNFWSSYALNIIYRDSSCSRVAFIAGKKIGKAHIRNFLKRRLRHLYSNNVELFNNKDVLFIAKKQLINSDFERTNKQIKKFKCLK